MNQTELAFYNLGVACVQYFVDTGECFFCSCPDEKTHDESCPVGPLVKKVKTDLG